MPVTGNKRKSRKTMQSNDQESKENLIDISHTEIPAQPKRRFTRSQINLNEVPDSICKNNTEVTKLLQNDETTMSEYATVNTTQKGSRSQRKILDEIIEAHCEIDDNFTKKNEKVGFKKQSRKTIKKRKVAKRGNAKKRNASLSSEDEIDDTVVDIDIPKIDTTTVIENSEQINKEVKSSIKRESTYILNEPTVTLEQKSKKLALVPASPCKLFRVSNRMNVNRCVTPEVVCRSITFGSAGQTPMPKVSKTPEQTSKKEETTPKNKIGLNITHSVEKPKYQLGKVESAGRRLPFTTNNLSKLPTLRKPTFETSNFPKKANQPQKPTKTTTDLSKLKSRGISKPNKKIPIKISDAKAKNILNLVQKTFEAKTPSKNILKPVQPISRSKMPNFSSLHKKQFERMESLLQNKERKEARAKQLLQCPKTPSKDKKSENPINKKIVNSTFNYKNNHKSLPNVKYVDSPATRSALLAKSKEQINEVSSSRKETTQMKTKKEQEYIIGVRTNRRFELQMKARNCLFN